MQWETTGDINASLIAGNKTMRYRHGENLVFGSLIQLFYSHFNIGISSQFHCSRLPDLW